MEQAIGIIIISALIGLVLGLLLFIPIVISQKKEREFCENHRKIRPGMFKNEVIFLLGNDYTVSYLKNGVEKMEWRYRHGGYTGRIAKGVYAHSSSFTRRISVKFKDDQVVEVKSLNMDCGGLVKQNKKESVDFDD